MRRAAAPSGRLWAIKSFVQAGVRRIEMPLSLVQQESPFGVSIEAGEPSSHPFKEIRCARPPKGPPSLPPSSSVLADCTLDRQTRPVASPCLRPLGGTGSPGLSAGASWSVSCNRRTSEYRSVVELQIESDKVARVDVISLLNSGSTAWILRPFSPSDCHGGDVTDRMGRACTTP